MNTLDLLQALILLGAPMVALSWFLFTWMFNTGEIDREDDRKAISARLKKMKKSVAAREHKNSNYVYEKWTWFGSGFYGLAALWTFAVIEIVQFFDFVFDFPGLAVLFEDGLVGFIVDFLLNQLGNVVQAFVWFSFWPADSIWIWILIAYLGYWAGVEMARRHIELPVDVWKQNLNLEAKLPANAWKQKLKTRLPVNEWTQKLQAKLSTSLKQEPQKEPQKESQKDSPEERHQD